MIAALLGDLLVLVLATYGAVSLYQDLRAHLRARRRSRGGTTR